MNSSIIKSCSNDTCNNCDIQAGVNCNFNPTQLLKFYLISLPSFILAGIFLYNNQPAALHMWLLIIGLFFLVVEIRVLCSHCPHYERSSYFLNCWANYGAPKLWKYRPGPMNFFEKLVLIVGFIVVWGYPVIYIILHKNWTVLVTYTILTTMFFFVLRTKNCVQCINLSCPLNNVDPETKIQFLKNNPEIQKYWKTNNSHQT